MADFKRHVAYKLKIGDVLQGKRVFEAEKFVFLDISDKKVARVNVVANVVDKYISPDKPYVSFTVDDASGQLRAKIFGDDVERFQNIIQGDTVLIIGLIKIFNDELYVSPEIIKKKDPKYLLVRKLEFDKVKAVSPNVSNETGLGEKLIQKIKEAEPEGISADKLILELKDSPDSINSEIKKALEEGIIYEPRPGIIRWLG